VGPPTVRELFKHNDGTVVVLALVRRKRPYLSRRGKLSLVDERLALWLLSTTEIQLQGLILIHPQ
jgi:hypothetical protein